MEIYIYGITKIDDSLSFCYFHACMCDKRFRNMSMSTLPYTTISSCRHIFGILNLRFLTSVRRLKVFLEATPAEKGTVRSSRQNKLTIGTKMHMDSTFLSLYIISCFVMTRLSVVTDSSQVPAIFYRWVRRISFRRSQVGDGRPRFACQMVLIDMFYLWGWNVIY